MMKKFFYGLLILLSSFVFLPGRLFSQETSDSKKHEFWHRVAVGGNVGFEFGSITGIVLSPEIRFRLVDQLYLGLGFNYQYLQYKDYYYNPATFQYTDFKSNVYGGRIFARYYLSSIFDNALGNIFGHLEYEYLTYTMPYASSGQPPDGIVIDPWGNWYRPGKQIIEISSLFIGGGYTQSLGGRAFLDLLILFNLNDSYLSPYSNPIIRLGFGVGL
jgi:hypothetical protein